MCFHDKKEHALFLRGLSRIQPHSAGVVLTLKGEFHVGFWVNDVTDKQEVGKIARYLKEWHPDSGLKLDLTMVNEKRQSLGLLPLMLDDVEGVKVNRMSIPRDAYAIPLFRRWSAAKLVGLEDQVFEGALA